MICLIENCLIYNNELKANGFICRFFLRNDEVDEFIKRRSKDFNKKIKCIEWKGASSKSSLSKHLENNNIKTSELKVVFVTGNGRMGARIEDSHRIYYGADFSPNSNLTAVIQGLLGRMTGNKSVPPIVFLEKKRVEELDYYVKTLGKKFTRNPHERAIACNDEEEGHTSRGKSLRFWVDNPKHYQEESKNEMKLSKSIQISLIDWTKDYTKNRDKLNGIRMKDNQKENFWKIFNHNTLCEIEKNLNIIEGSIIRYDPNNCVDSLYIDDCGHALDGICGVRDCTREARTNSPLKSTREKSGMKKEGEIRRLQPQLMVKQIKKGRSSYWSPIAIKFPLKEHMVINQSDMTTLPKGNDVGHEFFANEFEKARVL